GTVARSAGLDEKAVVDDDAPAGLVLHFQEPGLSERGPHPSGLQSPGQRVVPVADPRSLFVTLVGGEAAHPIHERVEKQARIVLDPTDERVDDRGVLLLAHRAVTGAPGDPDLASGAFSRP